VGAFSLGKTNYLRQSGGRISNREYQALFGVSKQTAGSDLGELAAHGLLAMEGAGRDTIARDRDLAWAAASPSHTSAAMRTASSTGRGAALLQQRPQAATRQVLYHQVDVRLHDLERVDGDAVGVVEATGCAGLLEEALEGHLIGLGGEGQFLDRDGTVEQRIVGQVDGAENALAQDAHDAVLEQLLVGGEGHAAFSVRQVHAGL
jgi:hypothetical protein